MLVAGMNGEVAGCSEDDGARAASHTSNGVSEVEFAKETRSLSAEVDNSTMEG